MDQIKKIKVGSTYYSMLPEGGTAGQVLKKNSATDFDVSWGNDSNTQSNWNTTNSSDAAFILNKPAIKASQGTNAVIENSINDPSTNNTALGNYSHAEGTSTKSIGSSSHSEGYGTITYGNRAHSEGFGYAHSPNYYPDAPFKLTGDANRRYYFLDTLDGCFSGMVIYYNGVFAKVDSAEEYEGSFFVFLDKTLDSVNALNNATVKIVTGVASGLQSHSEGGSTRAYGSSSHTEGDNTYAINMVEHAQGLYNKSNQAISTFGNAGNTINSIGIGTSESTRKNAVEVMQNGDVYVYGVGDYDGTNPNTTGIKTLQAAINDSSSELEVEEAAFPSGAAAGASRNFNIVLVDGGSPYDPQSGNVITINNADSTSGLGVRQEHLGGGTTLYCDNYSGDINYAVTTVQSGKVLIGNSNNKGSFRSTTQDVPTSTSATSYTGDHIVGGQALFKATERYITSGNSITNINANYNVGYYTSWWGNSTPSLSFSAFPTNKHMTLFIMGEITGSASDTPATHSFTHSFNIPSSMTIGSDSPVIFVNGARIFNNYQVYVAGNHVTELDAYYVVSGSDKLLIIRVDYTVN